MKYARGLLGLAYCLWCSVAVAQVSGNADLLSRPSAPYVAPNRLLSVDLPPNWEATTDAKNINYVEFKGRTNEGAEAVLSVERISVPPQTAPSYLMSHAVEHRFSKLPFFQEIKRRQRYLSGFPGVSLVGSYAYLGNLQFLRAFEETIVVAGNKAYVVHFECNDPNAPDFIPDLSSIYGSLVFNPAAAGGGNAVPFAPIDDLLKKVTF